MPAHGLGGVDTSSGEKIEAVLPPATPGVIAWSDWCFFDAPSTGLGAWQCSVSFNNPPDPSGTALIAVDADGDNTVVVSPGANSRVSADDVVTAAEAVLTAAVVLLQLEIPVEAVAAAVRGADGTVVLNPAPAPPAPLPLELLDGVDVLVPNQTELATMAGHAGRSAIGAVDPDTAVARARGLPGAAVVALGAHGAMVVTRSEATHVPAPAVAPVDTTAAGDAFCGALADAIVGGASLVDACGWAVRVGAAATLRHGDQPSLSTRAEVEHQLGGTDGTSPGS